MVLVTKEGIHFDCEHPIIGQYGITHLCSGQWQFQPWSNIDEIKVLPGISLRTNIEPLVEESKPSPGSTTNQPV